MTNIVIATAVKVLTIIIYYSMIIVYKRYMCLVKMYKCGIIILVYRHVKGLRALLKDGHVQLGLVLQDSPD